MILVGLIADRGYGHLDLTAYRAADAIICECFDRGRATNEWIFDDDEFRAFAQIVTLQRPATGLTASRRSSASRSGKAPDAPRTAINHHPGVAAPRQERESVEGLLQ
jgi:hypothetical protein